MLPYDYEQFPSFWDDITKRKFNLWSYVDARDVAQSCRRALEADIEGARHYVIAAADTVMNRPSADLLAEYFPEVPVRKDLEEFETLLSIDRAKAELGYKPRHSWRDVMEE
jgi:nucleoside-diphosphate-sugar epimerase